jgi:hypothetical protein
MKFESDGFSIQLANNGSRGVAMVKDINPNMTPGILTVMSKNIVGSPSSREDFVISYMAPKSTCAGR